MCVGDNFLADKLSIIYQYRNVFQIINIHKCINIFKYRLYPQNLTKVCPVNLCMKKSMYGERVIITLLCTFHT